jgi:hypothetical protein
MAEKYLNHDPDLMYKEIKKEFPRAKIVKKDKSLFMKIIFTPLSWVTGMDYINFFVTTILFTIYVPATWDDPKKYSSYRKFSVLRHEREHMRQFSHWPFGKYFWWINPVLMGIAYILILPVYFTMRAHFEKRGYIQNMLCSYEKNGKLIYENWEKRLVPIFCGPKYAWMSTEKRFKKWLKKTVDAINAEKLTR